MDSRASSCSVPLDNLSLWPSLLPMDCADTQVARQGQVQSP